MDVSVGVGDNDNGDETNNASASDLTIVCVDVDNDDDSCDKFIDSCDGDIGDSGRDEDDRCIADVVGEAVTGDA